MILSQALCSPRITSRPLALSSSHYPNPPLRFAVLGAGFAGLSVVWHLLKLSPKEADVRIDLYDEIGIGGGASGASGGLLHPYSPKARLLWRGAESWDECLRLLRVAEAAVDPQELDCDTGECGRNRHNSIVRRSGILRPAVNLKNLEQLKENAQNCLTSCRIETIDGDAAKNLVGNVNAPLNAAFYMPKAVNIYPQHYVKALFLACENLAKESSFGFGRKELYLHRKSVDRLLDFEGEYNAVIVCLGAKADMLPELSGRLPLRTCRGVVANMQLPRDVSDEYPDHGPSILSDAWLAIQGPRSLYMGSTWEWKSRNSSAYVSEDESAKALEELLPKASAVYPAIREWKFSGAKAGLRAMPPLTANGSLPLLGCLDEIVGGNHACKYWLIGGLGSRGLVYHSWLGKLTAQAVLSCNEDLIPSELVSWKKPRNDSNSLSKF